MPIHGILGLAKSNVNKRDAVPSTHNNLESVNGAGRDRGISDLRRQVQKHELELTTLTLQRVKRLINHKQSEKTAAPINNVIDQLGIL